MLNNIKGIILDWAGTSVDYGCMAPVKSFSAALANFGIIVNDLIIRKDMGLKKIDHLRSIFTDNSILEQWLTKYGTKPTEADLINVYETVEPMMIEIAPQYAKPITGAIEFMDTMKQNNVKVGSTTGYTQKIMEKLIPVAKSMGFSPDSIVLPNDVPQARPYPWMIYLNCIKMQTYPLSQMVKIGDTVADVQEGLNAGMWVIGLTLSGNEVGLSYNEVQKNEYEKLISINKNAKNKLLSAGAHYVADGIWDCIDILTEIDEKIKNNEQAK